MFRQVDTFAGGWKDKTVESMHRRRFENRVRQLPPLGADRLENLGPSAFRRKIECCWQDIEKKPIRKQQELAVKSAVLSSLNQHANCLSHDEHDLVERALILGGSAQIMDILELEAAQALSLRLWAHVGLVSGKPFVELEPMVQQPVAKVFASEEHENIRGRFDEFHGYMTSILYQLGAVDDRKPQQMILSEVLDGMQDSVSKQLARRFLWSSYDCVDYANGVLLVHSALAEPELVRVGRCRNAELFAAQRRNTIALDILPEEIPLERDLEYAMTGALRENASAHDVARMMRYLCKQGAPLAALEEVLQSFLMVHMDAFMRTALREMYYTMPKWAESREINALQ